MAKINNLPVILYCLVVGVAWVFIGHPLVTVAAGIAPIAIILVFKFPYMVCLGFIVFSFFRIHEAFRFLIPLHIPLLLALSSLAVLGWHLVVIKSIKL
ncbi:MAG: oligosaccharide repeat unit polymerase, partial [Psychrosphaera sp.]|nr:oligosaccharide repeat unit polymerase [Psychrosphaera sp.]